MDWGVGMAAKRGVTTYSPQADPAVSVISEEVLERAYLEAGRPELFDRGTHVPYITVSQGMWISKFLTYMDTLKPAALIQTGAFTGSSGVWCERAHEVGAVTIAGAGRATTAEFVLFWDYWMMGEEVLAAGAYVSEDPVMMATVTATDIVKYCMLGLLIVGWVLVQAGIDIRPMLKM
jgi:hypothetical protein